MRTRHPVQPLTRLDALTERFGLSDMLCALLLGGAAGVLLSWNAKPGARAAAAVICTLCAIASGWWASSLAGTFEVNRFGRRLLLHLYAYVSLFGIFMLIPLIGENVIRGWAAAAAGLGLVALYPAALVVENWRIRTEGEQREEKENQQPENN